MAIWFTNIEDNVASKIATVIKKYYPDLKEAGVTVGALMAHSDTGHPVMLGGYRCNAVIKVLSGRERVKGSADAEIIFDADMFEAMDHPKQIALIDHEIHHLELVKKNGQVKKDRYGRPRLGMKLHDFQYGWFKEVARRHGHHSFEVMQAKHLIQQTGQLFFPFADASFMASTGDAPKFPADAESSAGTDLDAEAGKILSMAGDPARALELTARMLDIRKNFKLVMGDRYDEMVNICKLLIKKEMADSGEEPLAVMMRLAKTALEDEGQLSRHNGIISAYVEMHGPAEQIMSNQGEDVTARVIRDFEAIPVDKFLYEQGFNARTIGALSTAGIKSGAALREWLNMEYRNKIPGVGQETEQKIADAVADWMINQTTSKK